MSSVASSSSFARYLYLGTDANASPGSRLALLRAGIPRVCSHIETVTRFRSDYKRLHLTNSASCVSPKPSRGLSFSRSTHSFLVKHFSVFCVRIRCSQTMRPTLQDALFTCEGKGLILSLSLLQRWRQRSLLAPSVGDSLRPPHTGALPHWLPLLPALSYGRRAATKAVACEPLGRPAHLPFDRSGDPSCSGRCIALSLESGIDANSVLRSDDEV